MKKLLFNVLIVALGVSTLSAGEFLTSGMKLGLNNSNFIGNDIPGKGVNSIPGFSLGSFLNYKLNSRFSLQPEFIITTKGSNINTVGDINLHNVFVYFEIPLLGKFTSQSIAGIKPVLYCGPAIGFKCLAINDTGMPDNIKNVDLGLILDAGIEFSKFALGLRYNRGLTKFDGSGDNINLKNSTISILVGYSF